MFTARRYRAADALAMGLVNQCYADDAFDGAVTAFMDDILSRSWFSHRTNKRVMAETDGWELALGLAHERDTHPGVDPDARERLARFSERK